MSALACRFGWQGGGGCSAWPAYGAKTASPRVATNAAFLVLLVVLAMLFTLFDDMSWFMALLLVKITFDSLTN